MASKITPANISTFAMSALIDFHNGHSVKQVSKFSDRKTAERRVLAILAGLKEGSKPGKSANKPGTSLKVKKSVKPAADRSASIAASWTNKKVAAARSARHGVKVGGEIYRSLPAAFRALNLPMGSMVRARLDLVANGKMVHGNHKFVLAS